METLTTQFLNWNIEERKFSKKIKSLNKADVYTEQNFFYQFNNLPNEELETILNKFDSETLSSYKKKVEMINKFKNDFVNGLIKTSKLGNINTNSLRSWINKNGYIHEVIAAEYTIGTVINFSYRIMRHKNDARGYLHDFSLAELPWLNEEELNNILHLVLSQYVRDLYYKLAIEETNYFNTHDEYQVKLTELRKTLEKHPELIKNLTIYDSRNSSRITVYEDTEDTDYIKGPNERDITLEEMNILIEVGKKIDEFLSTLLPTVNIKY